MKRWLGRSWRGLSFTRVDVAIAASKQTVRLFVVYSRSDHDDINQLRLSTYLSALITVIMRQNLNYLLRKHKEELKLC